MPLAEVQVRWYAGGRGEETPRAVLLGGRELALRVERGWLEQPPGFSGGPVPGCPPDPPGQLGALRSFQVRLEDGRRCRLGEQPDGAWTLEPLG